MICRLCLLVCLLESALYLETDVCITGFHEQQTKWAKDHEEQMALIRSLQQKMGAEVRRPLLASRHD